MVVGHIPNELVFLFSCPEQIGGNEVYPAYVASSDNVKTIASGEKWAKNRIRTRQNKYRLEKIRLGNASMTGMKIISLEHRAEGGRAYKVILPHIVFCSNGSRARLCVDLREDVLIDAITTSGIRAGGIMNGKFLFAVLGSQMRIIKEGTDLHRDLIQSTEDRGKKSIPISKLVIGHIYRSRDGIRSVYLGKVDSVENDLSSGEMNVIKNRMLWFRLHSDTHPKQHDTPSKQIENATKKCNAVQFDFKTSHSFIEDDGPSGIKTPIQSIASRFKKRSSQLYLNSLKFTMGTVVDPMQKCQKD